MKGDDAYCKVNLIRIDAEEFRDALEVAMTEPGKYTRKQWKVLTTVYDLLHAYTSALDSEDWERAKHNMLI